MTGATGFTGGHLARRLVARGWTVRALVRNASLASDLQQAGIELFVGDLLAAADLVGATRGVDVVFHVAAVYRQAGVSEDVYRKVNVTAVEQIIDAAAATGVRRVVHCSTVGVHGDVEQPPANEDAPLRPGDVYQVTKLQGEIVARETAARRRMDVVIVRPTGIYGPGDRRLLKMFRGVARGRFPMLGRGRIYYHLTYIDDLVEGLILCATHPRATNRTYILAGPEVTTLKELVAVIAQVAGVKPPWLYLPVLPFWLAGAVCEAMCAPFGIEPPLYRRRVDFYTKSRAFDISRARAELGYDPTIALREGITRTLEWYGTHGWL